MNSHQTGVGWLKSKNLQFSRCHGFVGFGNKVDVVVHTTTTHSGFLLTRMRMTLNARFILKYESRMTCLMYVTLWISELTVRDWMNVSLNFQRQKCGQWAVVSVQRRFVCRGLLHRRQRTGMEPLNLETFHPMQRRLSNILWDVWPSVIYTVSQRNKLHHPFCAQQHICYSAYMLSPVRLSVRLSHGWISQKRLKLGSCNFHHQVAPWL